MMLTTNSIDIRRFCVLDIGVDVVQHIRVARQIKRVAGVRHDVIFKVRLLARVIVERAAVAAAPAVQPPHVDGIGAEAVIDLRGQLRRRDGVFAADVTGGLTVGDVVEVDDAVRDGVEAQNLKLCPLLHQPAQLKSIRRKAEVLRCADVDGLFENDRVRIVGEAVRIDVAVLQIVKIGQIIRTSVFFQALFREIRHGGAARNRAGLCKAGIVARNGRHFGADIGRAIAAAGLRSVGDRLVRRAGDHADEQHDSHQDQHQQQNQPRILAQKALPRLFARGFFRPFLSGSRGVRPAFFHSNSLLSVCLYYTPTFREFPPFLRIFINYRVCTTVSASVAPFCSLHIVFFRLFAPFGNEISKIILHLCKLKTGIFETFSQKSRKPRPANTRRARSACRKSLFAPLPVQFSELSKFRKLLD
ncbi:MAG: hypothetical protein V8T01_02620 [Oscillospiraceae bacterium]